MPVGVKKDHVIQALSRYRGFVFRWQPYRTPSADWDHDHCPGCWTRFAERLREWGDAVHTQGRVTLWPANSDAESEYISNAKAAEHACVPSPKIGGFQFGLDMFNVLRSLSPRVGLYCRSRARRMEAGRIV